jgi:hypothetical protein
MKGAMNKGTSANQLNWSYLKKCASHFKMCVPQTIWGKDQILRHKKREIPPLNEPNNDHPEVRREFPPLMGAKARSKGQISPRA